MPTENQRLEQRVAALQSDLNTKDEQIDALTFSDNDRELSRRSWFDEAKRLEKEVEALRKALKFYADREHYHFESGNWDTVSGEPLNILWCGDEPDFIEDGTVARTALSVSAEPIPFPGYPPVPEDRKLPAEPKCQDGGMCGDSSHKCTGCAPVERDERAEFERWHAGKWPSGAPYQGRWEAWQARAVLDKATEGGAHEK